MIGFGFVDDAGFVEVSADGNLETFASFISSRFLEFLRLEVCLLSG